MANETQEAFKKAKRQREEAEFDKACAEFAKKLGTVTQNDLRVSRSGADSVPVQVFNKVAKAAARKKIN